MPKSHTPVNSPHTITTPFYGLWLPKNDPQSLQFCLSTGKWSRENCPDETTERQKIQNVAKGSWVFLYQIIDDIPINDSPFIQHLDHNTINTASTLTYSQCHAIGKVTDIHPETLEIQCQWLEGYHPYNWYIATRQDGLWSFNQNDQDNQQLFDMIFNGVPQDPEHPRWLQHINQRHGAIEIRIGKFIKEHLPSIANYCASNIDHIQELNNRTYSRETFDISRIFMQPTSNDFPQERYWAEEYTISDQSYRFCSQFGGSNPQNGEATKTQYQGRKFYQYLQAKDLLLPKYQALTPGQDLNFIVGNNNADQTNTTQDQIMQTSPLNKILYGPPGTSKTFTTISLALEVILQKQPCQHLSDLLQKDKQGISTPQERAEITQAFNHYKEQNQIGMVTFHQAFGYEEFVEGISVNLDDADTLSYQKREGVFKQICNEATSHTQIKHSGQISDNATIWKMSLGNSQTGKDKIYFEIAEAENCLVLGWGDLIDFSDCKRSNPDEGGAVIIRKLTEKGGTKTPSSPKFINSFINEMKQGDVVIISDGNHKFKAIARITGDYYFEEDSDYPQRRKIEWLQIFSTSKKALDISDKNFTQATINKPQHINIDKLNSYLSDTQALDNNNKNYVLIIDEINRGDIAKIFGELITLIEPSKRLGQAEALTVTLPHSPNEDFGVPSNLHIIGTMNTADRSIALLDTALRRRFHFIEMLPNPSLLNECGDVDLKAMLTMINQRIEYLYDREHQIGHAYLMGISDLEQLGQAFTNKIIPLLQEYFFDDWQKIRMVLGDYQGQQAAEQYQFIHAQTALETNILGMDSQQYGMEKTLYTINHSAFSQPASYQKIYDQAKGYDQPLAQPAATPDS